jgi:hypothetical protein
MMMNSFKEKTKEWLKQKENWYFLGAILIAIIVRFYYFLLTKNQPVWWDESEYLSGAKGFAGIIDYKLTGIRGLPGFAMFLSLFFQLGITNEAVLRFFTLFIPSILMIIMCYFMIYSMYNRKIALISTLILTFLWENLFYSNRFHTENIALFFQFTAIFILFYSLIQKKDLWIIKSKYSLIWIILFSFLSILFRPGNVFFIPAVFIFLLLYYSKELFTKKSMIFFSGLIIFTGVVYFIFNDFVVSSFKSYVLGNIASYPITFKPLTAFYGFYQSLIPNIPSILFYMFIIGIFGVIINLFLRYDLILKLKNQEQKFQADIFNLLIIISTLFVFIFLMRAAQFEYRWFFPLLPGMLAFTAIGFTNAENFLSNLFKNKKIALVILLLLLFLGLYTQLYRADNIIKMKLESYSQVRDAGYWIKQNSNQGDIVISASVPQMSYYSERDVIDFYVNNSNENEDLFVKEIKNLNPKYLVLSIFEPGFTPQWAYSFPEKHPDLIPIKTWFYEGEQKQLALVIYEFNHIPLNNSISE